MESQRQMKISKMLQRELADIFQLEAKNNFRGSLITVTKVKVTRDLSMARVYLSLFATSDKNELLEMIKSHTSEFRFHLGKRIKNQVRHIPQLQFFLDDSLDYIENIETLLDDNN